MDRSTFDEMVKVRANEVVQGRIKTFRQTVGKALADLHGRSCLFFFENALPEDHEYRGALKILLSDNPHKGWSGKLWDTEEENQVKMILNTMDSVQRAIMAIQRKDDSKDVESDRV